MKKRNFFDGGDVAIEENEPVLPGEQDQTWIEIGYCLNGSLYFLILLTYNNAKSIILRIRFKFT